MENKQVPIAQDMALVWAEQQEEKRAAFEKEQEQKRQTFELKLEKQKARREVMMLVITLAAVGAAFWTGWEGRHARIEADEAAKRSFQAQQTSMQLDERPFVVIPKAVWTARKYDDPFKDTPNSSVVSANATFLITGRTPAVDIRIIYNCVSDTDDWRVISYDTNNAFQQDISPLALNESFPSIHFCNLVTATPWYFKVKGKLTYMDLFQKAHSMTFCLDVAMRIAVTVGSGILSPCREFHSDIS